MIIRTLNDAKQFVENFKKYAHIDPSDGRYKFEFKDLNIYSGGTTEILLGEDQEYYNYSSGGNWHDRSENYVTDPVRYVWENRKSINAELKQK